MLNKTGWCMTRPLAGLAMVFMLLMSLGCSDSGELSEEQAAALLQRVEARWATKVAKDFAATYEFSTPNFREVFPKSLYLGKFSYMVDWELTGVEVLNYDADAAVASVAARVMTEPVKHTSEASRVIGAVPATIRERWILIDGEWWFSSSY
jgi:hypothetical protein